MYDLSELNAQQLQITYDTDGAILVSAGAGSGKTRLLTHRIAYLINDKGVHPSNILAITFTNKATNEMRERLNDMVQGANMVWVSTFHSMCARILRENISNMEGYTRFFTIYDDSDRTKVLKKIAAIVSPNDDHFQSDIDFHISNAKNMGLDPKEYLNEMPKYKDIDLIVRAYQMYEDELRSNNALDFDDLLLKTLQLLKSVPAVCEYYQNKFKYIHVDEFQDTNVVQYKLVKLLSAKHGNIFVVGDEDQCIYGWRGANIANIRNFITEFSGTKVYKLEQNYRSTKSILSHANMLIKNNTSRIDKTLFTDKADGDKVTLHGAYDEGDEGDYVARSIHNLINQGINPSDIAILMRISSLSRIFEEKLLNYNIPFKVSGIFKFFERLEIKNILAYMSVVVNDKDNVSLTRIINYPKRGIGEASIVRLSELARENGTSMRDVVLNYEKYDLPKALSVKIKDLSDILRTLIDTTESMSMTSWVKNMLDITDINNLYNTKSEEDINRKMNIDQFVQSVSTFENDNDGATIIDYLESVTLQNDMSDADTTNSVSVSTVHASKGLEFDYVFVIGAEDGIFPLRRSVDNGDLEEERRLMYVAVTRAKRKLYVTYAKSRFLYGTRSYTVASKFIEEMGLNNDPVRTQNFGATYNTNSPFKFNKIPEKEPAFEGKLWQNKISKQTTQFDEYKVGVMVLHPKFGIGTITKTEMIGDNSYVSVEFNGIGVKTLSLSFAPLQIIKKK